jgi:ADP-heptose:LPS heptosyltransferase
MSSAKSLHSLQMNLKRVELAWRRFWIRVLVRLMRTPRAARPAWTSGEHRALFLRHDRAGDMILSTGVMRAIARSHPTIVLDVLASPANASVLAAADYVRDVVVFDKRSAVSYLSTIARLRRARYDAVIDCMVNAPSLTTLLLILASGARSRVGIEGRGNDDAFNVRVAPEPRSDAHMVDRLGALAAAFGVDCSAGACPPALELTHDEQAQGEAAWPARTRDAGRRLLVNVSAGTKARLWPEERYVAVIRHLRSRDPSLSLRVIGAPAEQERAARVARDGQGELVRTPTLRDVFALVASADFVFTPDTSVGHAASAFRVPCVAMYIAGVSSEWGLYATVGRSVEHPEPTLATLSAARVIAAVDDAWTEAFSPRSARP